MLNDTGQTGCMNHYDRREKIVKLRAIMPHLSGASEWLNGEVTREQLIGKTPTLIHFWSVSCYLCKKAMPEVNYLRDRYRDSLRVIAVHMPRTEEDENIENIKRDATKYQITQPILIDGQLEIKAAFENLYVPAYYLFDYTGVLRHYQAGGSLKMLEKRIDRITSEQRIK